MDINKFIEGVDRMYQSYKGDWRWGQCLFNGLVHFRPDLSEQIRATPLDPFYKEKDEIKPELWNFLYANW